MMSYCMYILIVLRNFCENVNRELKIDLKKKNTHTPLQTVLGKRCVSADLDPNRLTLL